MPGIAMGEGGAEAAANDATKENASAPLSLPVGDSAAAAGCGAAAETSIEQLYNNVCAMESSTDGAASEESYGSDGEELRIDSELRHLVGGEVDSPAFKGDESAAANADAAVASSGGNGSVIAGNSKNGALAKAQAGSAAKKVKAKTAIRSQPAGNKGSVDEAENGGKVAAGTQAGRRKKSARPSDAADSNNGVEDSSEAGLDNPDLGPFLLKRARDLIASDNLRRALKYALRAAKSFEKCAAGVPNLDLVMCLHVVAAIYCNLGRYSDAVPVLQHSLNIPVVDMGQEHALAKFSGHMQLGDTYGMLGQTERSLESYAAGLEIQKLALGGNDIRVGETCRYLAEAHVQALRLDDAQRLCQSALDIHRENGAPGSLEEAADRRLMALICDTKGEHEAALEHLVMASMALVANGQETEVASVDCSIGDIYLSMGRFDEAVFAYQKALTAYKASKGENHPSVASVFVRLADLYNRTGKLRESKSYCENALRIYQKPIPGTSLEELATGLTDVSAIYESMNEHEQALKLLQKALKMYDNAAGQQSTLAGIEAQVGVLQYVLGNYKESHAAFKSAVAKLRASGEKKTAFFAIALNQMGLACVQQYSINEAAELFEEARSILEQEYGPYHPDTLGVYSNLAGTYDAMGRLDEAIEILEYVVSMREEKLGTANPDVDDEKRRLAELLKEAGRVRSRKAKSLEKLLENNPNATARSASSAVLRREEIAS